MRLIERVGDRHGEAHQIIAEAGIERIIERGDAFIEQAQQHGAIALRFGGFHRDLRNMAIGTVQRQREQPATDPARAHLDGAAQQQLLQRGAHRIGGGDRLGEALLGDDLGHRQTWIKRLRRGLGQRIERGQQRLAKTGGDSGAGQLRHLTHTLQPGPAQRNLHRFLIRQGGQRQINKARLAEAGQRHRGGRRGGQRVAGGKAEPVQPRQHVGDQAGLPAEQMGTASDVDHQAVRRLGRDHGGPAGGTIRQPTKAGRITRRIMRLHPHARQNGARIGQRQTGVQALCRRRRATSADDLAATIIGHQDEWFRRRGFLLPGEAFGGQPRQAHGQHPPHAGQRQRRWGWQAGRSYWRAGNGGDHDPTPVQDKGQLARRAAAQG